jgi:hypothetical protein
VLHVRQQLARLVEGEDLRQVAGGAHGG